jgi:hypothetical protein
MMLGVRAIPSDLLATDVGVQGGSIIWACSKFLPGMPHAAAHITLV